MENQKTETNLDLEFNEKDLKKKILKGGILDIESVLDELIKDVIQDDGIHKPIYNLIFKDLVIELEDELTSPLLKKNERIYKKVQVNKLKKLIQKLENEKEIDKYFQTLAEKETHLKEKNTTDQLDQTIVKEIKNSSLDESIDTNSERNIKMGKLSNEIDELINMMHDTGWKKVFWSEEDYEKYKKVLIEFFTTKDYSIPDLKIKIKPKSKTNIIGIFKRLHDKHSLLAGHLKDDTKLFEIVKILDQWSSQSNSEICKRISSDSLK